MATRKRKKFKVEPVGGPNSDINVTPLVDVVLVLLIIFMVVTPLLEKDIEVRVPQTEEVETTAEVPKDQLVVGVGAKGEITINNEPVAAADYLNRIKEILGKKKPGDKVAFFMAHDDASYATFVSVLDQTKLAGAEVLGMMTEVPEGMAPPGEAPPAPPTPPAPPPGP